MKILNLITTKPHVIVAPEWKDKSIRERWLARRLEEDDRSLPERKVHTPVGDTYHLPRRLKFSPTAEYVFIKETLKHKAKQLIF